MSYIVTDLQTKLKTQIGDPNLDPTVMLDALNYTQQAIFGTYDTTINSSQQINAVANGTSVLTNPLPTDFQRISSLYISSPVAYAKNLTNYFMPIKDFRELFPSAGFYSGSPQEWSFWTSVEFAVSSVTDLVVKIDYIKFVPTLNNPTDVPVIPQPYEELLLLGSKMRIYEQKEDFDYAGQFNARYADLVEAFIRRYSTRQVDNQMVVSGARKRV